MVDFGIVSSVGRGGSEDATPEVVEGEGLGVVVGGPAVADTAVVAGAAARSAGSSPLQDASVTSTTITMLPRQLVVVAGDSITVSLPAPG